MIDISKHKKYNKGGSYKENGETKFDENFSLTKLLNNCDDFKSELTMLQYAAKRIGEMRGLSVVVERSPKCHPEIAGEGIEYTWGYSKLYLQRIPISKRRNKNKFMEELKLALSTRDGAMITKDVVAKMCARARDYIVSYYFLNKENDEEKQRHSRLSKVSIERMRRIYRCHRSMIDLDHGAIVNLAAHLNSDTRK